MRWVLRWVGPGACVWSDAEAVVSLAWYGLARMPEQPAAARASIRMKMVFM